MAIHNRRTDDEVRIRQQIENFVEAFRSRDVNLMMSLYAPEMVAFDIVPPLQVAGSDVYRKAWEGAFALFQDPINIEICDLKIITDNDVAFSHKLLRLKATGTNGVTTDIWERLTLCFQKKDDRWLITHEHVSVPVNFGNGTAVLNLRP